jgi:hypothetical protein
MLLYRVSSDDEFTVFSDDDHTVHELLQAIAFCAVVMILLL